MKKSSTLIISDTMVLFSLIFEIKESKDLTDKNTVEMSIEKETLKGGLRC
jgi:hypothetical protein